MSFQKALRSDSDWDDEIVQVAGVLQVVDVHQSWCGPCKAVASTLKRVVMDHGDKPIKFFTADCEKIAALKKSVGGSEPSPCCDCCSSSRRCSSSMAPPAAAPPPRRPPPAVAAEALPSDNSITAITANKTVAYIII